LTALSCQLTTTRSADRPLIFRWKFLGYRVTFTFAPVVEVQGVNSRIDDDHHILMWDFDNHPIEIVAYALRVVQRHWNLPDIRILRSSKGKHYLAYSLMRTPWPLAMRIIAATDGIDLNFFKFGVYRGHFTLRTSKKKGQQPHFVRLLPGERRETVKIGELKSWTTYETLRD